MNKANLSPRAEILLHNSLIEYNRADELKKAFYKSHVENELKRNDFCMDKIGMGLDKDAIEAAHEFLKRIS